MTCSIVRLSRIRIRVTWCLNFFAEMFIRIKATAERRSDDLMVPDFTKRKLGLEKKTDILFVLGCKHSSYRLVNWRGCGLVVHNLLA
jgi:hypothetical protein